MDIQIVIRKSLVYSILAAVVSLIYLALVIGLEYALQRTLGYDSKIISITVAFGLGVGIIPLRNMIQRFVDKFFFKGSSVEIAEENLRLKQEINRTERLRTVATLASGMAHEIKNPLTAIKTFTEYLPKKMDDKQFLTQFGGLVHREVDRIDDLVHQLLEYARPTPPMMQPVKIIPLMNEILDLLSQKMIDHKIKLETKYAINEDVRLNLDRNQMKQAFLNIILNAIEAMPTGGELHITTDVLRKASSVSHDEIRNTKNSIRINISDTGTGVPEQDLKRIFDPFYSQKDGGTGLGLSITHEIIGQHGGTIRVANQENGGAVFTIELPLTSDEKRTS